MEYKLVTLQHDTGSSDWQLWNTLQQFTFVLFESLRVTSFSENIRTVSKSFVSMTVDVLLTVVFRL